MATNRPITATSPVFEREAGALSTNKVLRNTYLLLSATLLFSAVTAGVSTVLAVPYGVGLICSLVSLGMLWFVVPKTANSANGIWAVFAVTGLLGFGLGPVLNIYLNAFANGPQLVMMALGTTGFTFVGLSAYAVRSGRDFSFLRGFITGGIIAAFALAMISLVASLFGYYMQPLALGVSAMFTLLMCGFILNETSDIIQGHQTNYILATIGLYVSIYNLFTSILHLLGFAAGEE